MWITLLVLFMLLAACKPIAPVGAPAEPSATPVAPASSVDSALSYSLSGIQITLRRPGGWQSYADEAGIALAENPGSMIEGDVLQGILLYFWLPPLDQFVLPVTDGANVALMVLNQVIARPEHVGSGSISAPQPFNWGQQSAAYYMLADAEDVTLVIAVVVPGGSRLLAMNLSAPLSEAQRIRTELAALLAGLTVNGSVMDAAALQRLSQTLEFPH
ncbi:MAG: hypothetical protein HXY40_02375 [Chloroflexi bacterium]|nr:hypothetical protein [Chloroflexota bacterium]